MQQMYTLMEHNNVKSTLQVVLDKGAMDQVICFYL